MESLFNNGGIIGKKIIYGESSVSIVNSFDTIRLFWENNNWVGISNLKIIDSSEVDVISNATWINGSPGNNFPSISSGQFTTDSDYNSTDPRSGLHWSDSSDAGGTNLYFIPTQTSNVSRIEWDLRNRDTYGIPTVRVFLDNSEVNANSNITETGLDDSVITTVS